MLYFNHWAVADRKPGKVDNAARIKEVMTVTLLVMTLLALLVFMIRTLVSS